MPRCPRTHQPSPCTARVRCQARNRAPPFGDCQNYLTTGACKNTYVWTGGPGQWILEPAGTGPNHFRLRSLVRRLGLG